MADVCPRCGSKQVVRKKFGFGDVTMHERSCEACNLFEDHRSTDPDFLAWLARWSPDDDDDDASSPAAPPATPTAVAPPAGPAPAPAAPITTSAPAKLGTKKDELLRAICHDVGNDAPRLAYADAIAARLPDRAEFIRLQVQRARDEAQRKAIRGAPSAREAELRRRLGGEWAHYMDGYARAHSSNGVYRGWEFERGFVAELRTDPDMVADPRGYLFESAPIEHLDLTNDGPVLAAMASPWAAQVRSFGLNNLGLGDDDVVALVRDARLDRCEFLDLRSNKIGGRGIEALAASPRIRAIPMVLLTGNPVDPAVQYSDDGQGGGEMWLPDQGEELERTHGRIPWLYLPPERKQPDRYHARYVSYVVL